MTFECRAWASGNAWPCDLNVAMDPVAVVAVSFAAAIMGLGFLALIYLLAKRGSA